MTITLEDSVADWVRIEAVKRSASVSRLVGEMLAEKMRHVDAYEVAMREALKFKPINFDSPFMTRDEIYAERPDRYR